MKHFHWPKKRLATLLLLPAILMNALFAAEKINQSVDLGGNRQATWYLPDQPAQGWVLLQHGFQRNKSNMDHLATHFMNNGLMVLTINSSATGGNPSLGRDIADDIIDNPPSPPNGVALPSKLIVAGHSAGGLMMTHTGGRLVSRQFSGLVGAILLDPVDANDGMQGNLQLMWDNGVPSYSILANASSCNSSNNALGPLRNLSASFVGIKLTNNSKHTDAEGDSSGGIITWLCGSPKAHNVAYLQDFATNWALDMVNGTLNSDYYPGGSVLQSLIDSNDGELIKEITAPQPPSANFNFSVNQLQVSFTDASMDSDGEIVAYDWDFGDGQSSAQANPVHTYSSAGSYTVNLTVTDNDGMTSSVEKLVVVNDGSNAPVASFNYAIAQNTVTFTDGSSDSDGSITAWQWTFGDGNSSAQANPQHTYSSAGTYTVILTVTDNDGNTDSASAVIQILADDGLANPIEINNLSGSRGEELHYKMQVPAGATNLSFSISGGSGDADIYVRRGAKPTTSQYDYRPYLNGNNETVSISAPQADTWYLMIRGYQAFSGVTLKASYNDPAINNPPTANFSVSTNGLQANFNDLSEDSDGSIATYQWQFGDGNESGLMNPNHNYATAGSYTVTLTVTDDDGASDQMSQTVTVSGEGTTPLQNGQPVPNLSGTTGTEKHFVLAVPPNTLRALFEITGGTGDADIYVRFGAKPTTSQWDYRPYLSGNEETVEIPGASAGNWYVMVRAYSNYSGVTLTGIFEDNE